MNYKSTTYVFTMQEFNKLCPVRFWLPDAPLISVGLFCSQWEYYSTRSQLTFLLVWTQRPLFFF